MSAWVGGCVVCPLARSLVRCVCVTRGSARPAAHLPHPVAAGDSLVLLLFLPQLSLSVVPSTVAAPE